MTPPDFTEEWLDRAAHDLTGYIGCFLLLVGASFAGGAWALGRVAGWW